MNTNIIVKGAREHTQQFLLFELEKFLVAVLHHTNSGRSNLEK